MTTFIGRQQAFAYGRAALIVASCSLLGFGVFPYLSLTDVAMVYLFGVAVVAARQARGPAIMASFLSTALFDYLFVPPRFTFGVSDFRYTLTFGVMLLIALFMSTLIREAHDARERAESSERR